MSNETTASREWATRPADERMLTLEEAYTKARTRAENSTVKVTATDMLKVYGTEQNELIINTELGPKIFTNWSFGQVSQIAGAPASYLRKLPSELAAACLNDGFQRTPRERTMLMANGNDTLRCATSETYGRIYDHQVIRSIMKANHDNTWKIPAASYATQNPRRASTIYVSDRDIFIFLVDDQHPIEVGGKPMFRGFYTWNSEVGAQVWGLATFLYEYVCDNRIIWGMTNRNEIRVRHTSGGPERFELEGEKALIEYANQSAAPLEEQIRRAQNLKIGKDEDEVKDFLKKRGLTGATAENAVKAAKMEGNDFLTSWGIAEGLTAHARSIDHTDDRVKLEREAGKILDYTLK